MNPFGLRRVHMVCIGGVAMSALAVALKRGGVKVSGSDEGIHSPVRERLAAEGLLPASDGYSGSNIVDGLDAVVVGMHARGDNVELVSARELGLNVVSFPAFLAGVLAGYEVVAVAGTNGKTTTAALIGWVLECAGMAPSYLVGGVCRGLPDGMRLGGGRHFVIEADEYPSAGFDPTPKFLYYRPGRLVLTGVELDHVNVYRSEAEYVGAFRSLIEGLGAGAPVVACRDDSNVVGLLASSRADVEYYSRDEVVNVRYSGALMEFEFDGLDLRSRLFGRHNAGNIVAAVKMCRRLGVADEMIADAVFSFGGVRRRMEVVHDGAVTVLDDLAHNPSKVRETIRAVRDRYPGRRVWAVFEPHTQSSIRADFVGRYSGSFERADEVVFYMGSDSPSSQDGGKAQTGDYEGVAGRGASFSAAGALSDFISANRRDGDVFLFMSSGSFDGALDMFVRRLGDG